MRFQLSIQCNNDAFQGDPGAEIARILEKLARSVVDVVSEHANGGGPLHDANGNRIGRWGFSDNPGGHDAGTD